MQTRMMPTLRPVSSINTSERPGWLDYAVPHNVNPSEETLRTLAIKNTPVMMKTAFNNLNKVSRNKARMAKHTYIITDGDPEEYSHKLISVTEASELIAAQAAYIKQSGSLLEIQGWVGVGPHAVPVQWLYTKEAANIAAMQQVLSFPRERVEDDISSPFNARFRVVYTPDFRPDVSDGQRILVDLENYVTYIMGPDYFGESKKGALRMLCHACYQEGALVMHAGAKEVIFGDHRMTTAILGLSGTGKTTTTFSKQGDSVKPVQDDMITLWPEGEISVTENGCFAKTFGLSAETEPVLYRASVATSAWLENAYQDSDGKVDFFKTTLTPDEVKFHFQTLVDTGFSEEKLNAFISGQSSLEDVLDSDGIPEDGWEFVEWTGNGRSVVPLSAVEDAADLDDLPPVQSIGVLNRDEGAGAITPGIVRFSSPEQAAGYFMLGETTKTSAAGKERGKTRSPFTQPFFPLNHKYQAKRFAELLSTTKDLFCWMMNTGFVGGQNGDEFATKVKIRHSSAMLEGLFADTIKWVVDEDFGYEVVDIDHPANAALLEIVPADILRPDRFYSRTNRADQYKAEVAARHTNRRVFLEQFDVDTKIIDSVVR